MDRMDKSALPMASALITPSLVYWALNYDIFTAPYPPNVSVLMLMSVAALLVSVAHVIFLGLPSIWLLKKLKIFRWWSILITGFILGCTPMAIFSWPRYPAGSGSIDGGVVTVVNGIPTHAWWMGYIHDVAGMGAIGGLTALVYWCVWARVNSTFDSDASRLSI